VDNVPHASSKHKLKLWRSAYANIMCYKLISTIFSPSKGQSFYNIFFVCFNNLFTGAFSSEKKQQETHLAD